MIFLQAKQILFEDKLYTFIYLPIVVWIAVMLIYLFFLSRRYTFGNWTKDNPNPYLTETMGLPRGTMRGIITLTLLFGVLIMEIFAIENPQFEGHIAQFIVAFQMMLAFYFGSKVMHHLASVDRKKTASVTDSITKVEEVKAGVLPPEESGDEEFSDEEAVG